jgi:enamine deaminase RidA (YjgF/YER057c/UK114 family)
MEDVMKKYLIEREIPKVGDLQGEQLRQAAETSNNALAKIGSDEIQWVESYVADNKTFCIYLAQDESVIRKHAELSGFPADKITEIGKVISPKTASELC